MVPDKYEILSDLHTVVSHNVIGEKQLFNRYKGFKAELEFTSNWMNQNFLEGGTIISKTSNKSSLIDAIYFTVIQLESDIVEYSELYSRLSRIEFTRMFLVKYDPSKWERKTVMVFPKEKVELLVPEFEIFEFNYSTNAFVKTGNDISVVHNEFNDEKTRKKNSYKIDESYRDWLRDNLQNFDLSDILNLYVTRLIFDGYIGFGKQKGKPSDIDFIYRNPKGLFRLIELKEKDLPKKAKKGFGLDVPRISDFLSIQRKSELKYFLIVRHVKDQQKREFLEWLYISIDAFVDDVKGEKKVEGGTGMRSNYSSNPTLICSYEKFKVFK